MDMVLSARESRKKVDAYVLLPPGAKRVVELLINSRTRLEVSEMNEFIFACFSANNPKSGNNELREVVLAYAGLQSVDKLISTSLRKVHQNSFSGTLQSIFQMLFTAKADLRDFIKIVTKSGASIAVHEFTLRD
jgi:hypothetical protein